MTPALPQWCQLAGTLPAMTVLWRDPVVVMSSCVALRSSLETSIRSCSQCTAYITICTCQSSMCISYITILPNLSNAAAGTPVCRSSKFWPNHFCTLLRLTCLFIHLKSVMHIAVWSMAQEYLFYDHDMDGSARSMKETVKTPNGIVFCFFPYGRLQNQVGALLLKQFTHGVTCLIVKTELRKQLKSKNSRQRVFAGGVHIHPAGLPGAPLHRGEAAVHRWRPAKVCSGGPPAGCSQQGLSSGAAQDTHQERGSLLWVCEAAGIAAPSTPPTPPCCHTASVPVWGLPLFVRYACCKPASPPHSPPPPRPPFPCPAPQTASSGWYAAPVPAPRLLLFCRCASQTLLSCLLLKKPLAAGMLLLCPGADTHTVLESTRSCMGRLYP